MCQVWVIQLQKVMLRNSKKVQIFFYKYIEVGDYVAQDEVIALIETDKITIDIRCADAGIITKLFSNEGAKVEVGKPFYEIDVGAG